MYSSQVWLDIPIIQRRWFRHLEQKIPPPKRAIVLGISTFRYEEQLPEQALVQKLAREVSGLVATKKLHDSGLFQEQGVLQRTLDEINEDIAFLAFGICQEEDLPELHTRYLKAFWQEEFSEDETGLSSVGRVYPPRRKIRSYLNRFVTQEPEAANRQTASISSMNSGYIHGASPHIMDMCWGEDALFQLDGMTGTPLEPTYRQYLDNNLYRATISVGFTAKALGDVGLFEEVAEVLTRLEGASEPGSARPFAE